MCVCVLYVYRVSVFTEFTKNTTSPPHPQIKAHLHALKNNPNSVHLSRSQHIISSREREAGGEVACESEQTAARWRFAGLRYGSQSSASSALLSLIGCGDDEEEGPAPIALCRDEGPAPPLPLLVPAASHAGTLCVPSGSQHAGPKRNGGGGGKSTRRRRLLTFAGDGGGTAATEGSRSIMRSCRLRPWRSNER